MKKAIAATRHKLSADEKLLRIEQVRACLADYDGKQLPLDPDEVDHFVHMLKEWAGLAGIWPELTAIERDGQWMMSVFPVLIRAARAELMRIADGIERVASKLIEKHHPSTQGPEGQQIAYRVSLARAVAAWDGDREGHEALAPRLNALADSQNYPECIWAKIMQMAYTVGNDPGTLSDLRLAELRGDLLMVIAEINRAMFLAILPYANGNLTTGRKQARHAKEGGNERRIPAAKEEEWKKEAERVLLDHPRWRKKSDVAREVAKNTGGSYDTIRQREWLDIMMKSDRSIG